MLWQTYELANYVSFTNAPTKDQVLPIFVFTREVKEVLCTMILDHLVNDSVESSFSSDEEDVDFILLELACRPKTVSKGASHSHSSTSGVSLHVFRAWHVQWGHTHLDYWKRALQVCQQPTVSTKSSIIGFYLLGHEDQFSSPEGTIVHLDTFWIFAAW